MNFYKATRPDGTDFRTGTIDYAGALASGDIVKHPRSERMHHDEPWTYLSISTEPAETLIGGDWPCRLFRVEPVKLDGSAVEAGDMLDCLSASPHKRAVLALRMVEELPAHLALGPNGEAVAALIERTRSLSVADLDKLYATRGTTRNAAWDATRNAAWDATRGTTRNAAWDATRNAAWGAAWDAAWGVLVRDLISPEHYRILTTRWATVIGPAHPDDDVSMYSEVA